MRSFPDPTAARKHGVAERDYLLLLGANMALRERAVVAALRTFPGPLATLSSAVPPRGDRHFDIVLPGRLFDPESTLAAVLEFEKRTGSTPAAVVPFVDPTLTSGLAVAEHYGLPYLSPEAVHRSSVNKDRMKECLQAAGVPTPAFRRFHDPDELWAGIAEVGLPCVIKPSGFGGSMGVTLVRDESQVEERCAYVLDTFEANRHDFGIRNPHLQVEAFCDLPHEVSVEVLTHGGRQQVLAVTDKSLGPAPYFAETGHRVPSVHTDDPRVGDLALRACAAIGMERGVAHAEIRLDGAGAMQVIEVAARTGGDGILDLVERTYGIAPYELHIRSYLDDLTLPVPVPPPSGLSAIAMLKAPPGRIASVAAGPDGAGADGAGVDGDVLRWDSWAAAGDVSGEAECYVQREGYVEMFWPGTAPADVPPDAHVRAAAAVSAQMFRMEG